jgi:hypothetical protein
MWLEVPLKVGAPLNHQLCGRPTIVEERHCGILREFFICWKMPEIGDWEWEHGKLVFTGDMQHGAAGHEQLEVRTVQQQVDQQRGGFHDLFEVVQQQQVCFLTQSGFQLFKQWLLLRTSEFQRVGNRGDHEIRIAESSKGHQRHPIGKVAKEVAGDMPR